MPPGPGVPKRIGHYEVGAKIAGGGMASVYIGRTENRQDEVVALKLMRNELAQDESFIDMFLDEAKLLSKLSHPNIIRTFEFGVSGEHRFIAMELLLGRSLIDVWQVCFALRRRLPFDLMAWIAASVANGLHYAHELTDEGRPLSIIHRDVNPSNIFLTYQGEVKLLDFGLAKAADRRSRSAEGIVKGKIPYLSPEQLTRATIDRRSDIFGLGITIWECTTMRRLFKRETDVATLRAIREGVVPDARTIVPDYPDRLWDIVHRALEPDRDQRYPTANALRDELLAFVGRDSADMQKELGALMSELFAGEQPKQMEWLEQAKVVSPQTLAPPAPVAAVTAATAATEPLAPVLQDESGVATTSIWQKNVFLVLLAVASLWLAYELLSRF